MSFKLWVNKLQRLDHKQKNLFLLPTKGIHIHLMSNFCAMSSPHKPPTLGLWLSFILAPAASTVLLGMWTEKSLSHLVGGPGPQDAQAKNVTPRVSNMLLQGQVFPRKGSNKKRNSRIVHTVMVLNRERNSEISLLHMHQLHNTVILW